MSSWLIDKSELVRLHLSPEAEEWSRRIERGRVAATTATQLELGFSVRNGADHARALSLPPLAPKPVEYLTPAIEDRAVEVQGHLASLGLHRAPSVPDLLIAAAAELSGRTLLHLDKDFDLIADITGQPVERLTKR